MNLLLKTMKKSGKFVLYAFLILLVLFLLTKLVITSTGSLADAQKFFNSYGFILTCFRCFLLGVLIYFYPSLMQCIYSRSDNKFGREDITEKEEIARKQLKSRWIPFGIVVAFELLIGLPVWLG